MSDFSDFARKVESTFQRLTKKQALFVADLDGTAFWEMYLAAFPEGTNPIFKTRTEHDCACCRHFVRRVGLMVAISDGKIHTVWDDAAEKLPGTYGTVAKALQQAVRNAGVRDLFRVKTKEARFGAIQTRSIDAAGKVTTWNHFHGEVPAAHLHATPEAVCGDYRTTVQVFQRSLDELSPDAVATVLSLIESNSLYRGAEHKRAVVEFQKMQRAYLAKDEKARNLFVWEHATHAAARFRNTVIGTLVQDLSEGQDLERAVSSFETKVAPQNYKRPTALITPAMVANAMQTIESLGLEPALERRLAVIGDISVNDVKWVDGASRPLMKEGIGDILMKAAATSQPASKDEERAEDITIDDFMARVLPEAQGMELRFEGRHTGNLMVLTAPVHPEPKQLFRWTNDYAWSYGGNVADSTRSAAPRPRRRRRSSSKSWRRSKRANSPLCPRRSCSVASRRSMPSRRGDVGSSPTGRGSFSQAKSCHAPLCFREPGPRRANPHPRAGPSNVATRTRALPRRMALHPTRLRVLQPRWGMAMAVGSRCPRGRCRLPR